MRIFSCLNLCRVTSLFPSQIYISRQKNFASFPHEIFSLLLSFKLLFFFLVATIVLRHQTLEIHYQIQFFFLPITYRYLPVLFLSLSLYPTFCAVWRKNPRSVQIIKFMRMMEQVLVLCGSQCAKMA